MITYCKLLLSDKGISWRCPRSGFMMYHGEFTESIRKPLLVPSCTYVWRKKKRVSCTCSLILSNGIMIYDKYIYIYIHRYMIIIYIHIYIYVQVHINQAKHRLVLADHSWSCWVHLFVLSRSSPDRAWLMVSIHGFSPWYSSVTLRKIVPQQIWW